MESENAIPDPAALWDRSGSWPCDNALEGVSAGRDRRDALQGDYFEHIFPISVWETTWFVIGPS
jgi:hypothetical protein